MELICFTGMSATGKTTLGKMLASEMRLDFLSVRSLIKNEIAKRGYNKSRELRLEIGEIEFEKLCNDLILNYIDLAVLTKKGLVIDDIFSYKLLNCLKDSKLEINFTLIALKVDFKLRQTRISVREGASIEESCKELLFLDEMKINYGIKRVIEAADITIITDMLLEENYKKLISCLHEKDL